MCSVSSISSAVASRSASTSSWSRRSRSGDIIRTDPEKPRMRKWVAQAVVSALGGSLLLAGLLFLGREAGERLHDERRCTASFAAIECEPQAPLDRADFLTEV